MMTIPPTATHPDVERVLISESDIQKRIVELAGEIDRDYQGRSPVLIGILKGSVLFLSDLLKRLSIDCRIDFMCVSSYEGERSTGVVRLTLDLRENIEDRDILIVEDIVDTGLTLGYLKQNLMTRKPRSLEIVSLLDKPEARKVLIEPKYRGFQIPNEFVVGYGLDFDERYRNLPYIGVLKPSTYQSQG